MNPEELAKFEEMEKAVYSMIQKKQLIEIPEPTKPIYSCIVLYFDDQDKLCHSAKMDMDSWPKVTSIWVNRHAYMPGKIVSHGVWEVPTSFGTKVKYFWRAPNLSEVWN